MGIAHPQAAAGLQKTITRIVAYRNNCRPAAHNTLPSAARDDPRSTSQSKVLGTESVRAAL